MKLGKIAKAIMIMVILVAIVVLPNYTSAAEAPKTRYFKITATKPPKNGEEEAFGYGIGKPMAEGGGKIWNIWETSGATSDDLTDGDFYCVKAGVGFSNTNTQDEYKHYFNMRTERAEIEKEIPVLKEVINGTFDTGENRYNSLLALFDMLLLDLDKVTENEKTAYLKAAGIHKGQYNYEMTIDDIEAVQQAAIWYFTNYEKGGQYDNMDKTTWLTYTLDGEKYDNLTDYNPTNGLQQEGKGFHRNEQAVVLYKYLVNTAKANSEKYASTKNVEVKAPAKLETTVLAYEENGSNYIMGPIKITETANNNIPYTLDFVVKNGEQVITPTLLDENKQPVSEDKTVEDLVGKNFYISMPKEGITTVKVLVTVAYKYKTVNVWTDITDDENVQPIAIPEEEEDSEDFAIEVTPEQPEEPEKEFDLALRKYITKVGTVSLEGTSSRVPVIDTTTLDGGKTAKYKHKKDPVIVTTGDKVTYELTIYNEGEKAGRATKVVDQLPTGLKFNKVVSGKFELDVYDAATNTLKLKRVAGNEDNLPAYTKGNLKSETIEIECEVTEEPDTKTSKILTNVAWISEEFDAEDNVTITNQKDADRDSEPTTAPNVNKDSMSNYTGSEDNKEDLSDSKYYYKGQQDDDDFEKLVMLPESFDLKLIKRIVAVNNQNVPERIQNVDVSKLNTIDENGNTITTGEYTLNKEPVTVKKGDIVTYTFRIYNEGTIDGYAQEITEDIPEGLQFLWSEKEGEALKKDTTLTDEEKEAIEFNQKFLWGKFVYDEEQKNIIKISSDYLSKENETTVGGNLIPAFGKNDGTKTEADIHYKEISVKLKVVSEDTTGNIIRNEACISKDADGKGNPVDDRDSKPEDWKKYEDDEDYDNIILRSFDLALRKFITAVSKDEEIAKEEELKNEDGSYKRAPVVDTSKLNAEDEEGNLITTATYNHTKEPVLVQKGDFIVYMLRVYNEGETDGYASEIKDHLPPYLEFVDNEFNKKYGWEVSEDGRTVTTKYLANEKIEKAKQDKEENYVLSYKEVPVMCKVSDKVKTSEKITNIADITEYLDENKNPANDRDSLEDNVKLPEDEKLPSYKDDEKGEYVPGQEDDDDFEKVIVKEFDLALRKWVTQAIVTENGNTTITDTGHKPYDDPEQIVKVELHRKKLNQVVVKFKYSIRVINEGDVEGYVKEITDYVPQGLKFVAEDNPGWKDEGNNAISTRLLENTLLKPGEYADVEVILTWINSEDNMGVMVNTAEISEDDNKYDLPDKDSTPDNKKPGEDDIDDAPVMISISTGKAVTYFTLGFTILATIAGGVALIKKYVL